MKPYKVEMVDKVIEEFHRRFEENKHFNLKKMLDSDEYEPGKYNIATKNKNSYEDQLKAFKEKMEQDRPDGLQGDELKDWLKNRFQTLLDDQEEELLDDFGITKETPDDFGEQIAIMLKYMNNPFALLPTSIYESMSIKGLEFKDIFPNGGSNLDLSKIKVERDAVAEQSFLTYSRKIHSKSSKRLDSLKDGLGFIIPTFDTLIRENKLKTEYNDLKQDLDNMPNISASISIANYRDLLEKQLERQISVIVELNRLLLDYLDLFYVEAEINFLEVMRGMKFREKRIEEPHYDLFLILLIATNIHKSFFSNSSFEYEIEMHRDNIIKIPYVPKLQREYFIEKMETIFNKKKPILEVSALLVLKIRICESLLEDLITNKRFKTEDEVKEILKIEQSSKSSKKYAFHSQNSDWIKNTFEEEMGKQPSQNKAAIKTGERYEKEFGYSISPSHIYELAGVYK